MGRSTEEWVAERFSIPLHDVVGYNSGTCFDKAWVKTEESAKAIQEFVKDETVNGGYFHGQSLGRIEKYPSKDGGFIWEVTC